MRHIILSIHNFFRFFNRENLFRSKSFDIYEDNIIAYLLYLAERYHQFFGILDQP